MIRGWSARLSDPWVGRGAAERPAAAPEREVRRRCACDGRLGAGCTACGGTGKRKPQRRPAAHAGGFDLATLPITAGGAAGLDVSQPGDPGELAADTAAAAALRDPPAPRAPDAASAPAGSGGAPLPDAVRGDFEARFDHDFGPVRIHTDAAAQQSAAALDAEAYTVGGDIVFAAGAYAPGSGAGRDLLAHELAHVVQAGAGGAAEPGVARRARRDDCDKQPKPRDPCAAIPAEDRREVQSMLHGPDELQAMSELLERPATEGGAAERVALLKAAACTLSPGTAADVRQVFTDRAHVAGERFGRLATASRCAILHILDSRIAAGAVADAVDTAMDAMPFTPRKQPPPGGGGGGDGDAGERRAAGARKEQAQREREEAQFKRDRELLAKSGKLDAIGFLLPDAVSAHRIPYSEQIHNPLLRWHARINERGAFAIGRFGATGLRPLVADPVAYAVIAVEAFFTCMKEQLGKADAAILTTAISADPLGVFGVPDAFRRGAAVGLGEDFVEAIEQLAEIIEDPAKFVRDTLKIVELMFSPEGEALGCAIGGDLGEQFVETLRKAAPDGLDAVSFQLGRQLGPSIVYTVLAFLAPGAAIARFGGKLLARLLKILATIADKLPVPKWVKKPAKALAKRKRIKPRNGKINVGGEHEAGTAESSNLNPNTRGVKNIPNHVDGWWSDIGEVFEHGSATEVVANKVPASTGRGTWPQAAQGTYDVLAPGGTIDLHFWGAAEHVDEAVEAFRAAGFKGLVVEKFQAGAIVRGHK
jgi:hypothetical protein